MRFALRVLSFAWQWGSNPAAYFNPAEPKTEWHDPSANLPSAIYSQDYRMP